MRGQAHAGRHSAGDARVRGRPADRRRGDADAVAALARWMMDGMEVLGSRILLRPAQLRRSHRFYRDTLGLAIYREFGGGDAPGVVFFLGNGLLEVSGRATDPPGDAIALWMQVRDIRAEHRRLVDAGVRVVRGPQREVWGLEEMWIADPDGVRIVLVEIPEEHPLRRDSRHLAAADE
jgi:catechol 2,3-dioxygenase-like lactoylglutathione lyase family enzyme